MAKVGYYRATLNGFSVVRETWDHALDVDGKRDEVYIAWTVSDGTTERRISPILGDTNGFSGRVRAGRASPTGGLMTGDRFPDQPEPWRIQAPTGQVPPLVLWEGNLSDGDRVVITPTIWEADGATVDPAPVFETLGAVAHAAAVVVGAIPAGATQIAAAVIEIVAIIVDVIGKNLGVAGDRPIGCRVQDGSTNVPTLVLNLTQKTAETLATTNGSLGRGVRSHPFKDPPDIGEGTYEIYYQVQRIGDLIDDGTATTVDPPSSTLVIDLKKTPNYKPVSSQPSSIALPAPGPIASLGIKTIPALSTSRFVEEWAIEAEGRQIDVNGGTIKPSAWEWFLDGTRIGATRKVSFKQAPDGQEHELLLIAKKGTKTLAATRTFRAQTFIPVITLDVRRLAQINQIIAQLLKNRHGPLTTDPIAALVAFERRISGRSRSLLGRQPPPGR